MSPVKDRGIKSETLSLRLDPKIKFILEFVARINGQTLTTVVERAIRKSCNEVTIASFRESQVNWQYFWDPDEGVRTLKLLACEDYPSTYDEDDLRRFTQGHWEFFYTGVDLQVPHRPFLQILWPKIEDYRRIWREHRESDYWAAGKAMAADISAARIKAPTWPRLADPAAREATKKDDLDEEIPF
jgi:hypothetical protein